MSWLCMEFTWGTLKILIPGSHPWDLGYGRPEGSLGSRDSPEGYTMQAVLHHMDWLGITDPGVHSY